MRRLENMITSEEDGVFKSSEIIDKPVAVNEPTLGEVKETIKRLKNGKVPGIVYLHFTHKNKI